MRRVLVTGGGSGIGRAVARAFDRKGDAVTIAGRRREALDESASGFGMTCREADVTDEASVAAIFDAPFDVVVANAGSGAAGKLRDMTLADWNRHIAVNLTGTFLTFREALRAGMGAGGRLIAVASTAGLRGQANVAAYSAAKHGVVGMVAALAQEVAREGITVNAVCPHFVDTPLVDESAETLARKLGTDKREAKEKIAGANPLGRLIAPEEVAAAVLYLASDEAAMVTGHPMVVSGGWS